MTDQFTYIPLQNLDLFTLDAKILLDIMEMYPRFANFLRHRSFRRISFWKCLSIGIKKFQNQLINSDSSSEINDDEAIERE